MYRLLSGDPEALEEQDRDNERIRLKEKERANKCEQEKAGIGNRHERLGPVKGEHAHRRRSIWILDIFEKSRNETF